MKMKHAIRRTFEVLLSGAALFAVAGPSAVAQSFPEKPITLIVPWAPGGGTDQTSRVLAKAAEAELGQPVVVINKPGAAGFIGMTEMAKSRPDGYTLATMSTSHFLAPLTGQKVPFDPLKDVSYIMNYGDNLIGIAVLADSPWKTLADLIEDGKKRRITYGTAGVNSLQHLMMESLKQATGANLVHVPQQGSAASVPALLGRHVEVLMEVSAWAPFVESKQVRLLAVSTPERAAAYPDVPTLEELGFQSMRSMQTIVAPAGIPEPVRAKLEDAFRKALSDSAFNDTIKRLSMQVVDLPGAQARAFVEESSARTKELLTVIGKPGS